ncbi:MAG: hypothetical protein KatS3mg032_0460 [Cyclobacteriaceae bacterium]|nr:MAG: hypothetical protein KatS3mg032_0460 [Cyclobacteriaceae bacterium]
MLNILIFFSAVFAAPADSIGTEMVNGKLFVIHKVDEKETLYSLSRRYGATIAQILEYNPTADAGLAVGQILRIPYSPRTPRRVVSNGIIHKVAEKETLFSISRLYEVSVDEIRQWNNLPDNTLAVGQELLIKKPVNGGMQPPPDQVMSAQTVHTVQAGETLFSISKKYGIALEQIKEWNGLAGNELKIGQKLFVSQPMHQATAVQPSDAVVKPDSSVAQSKTMVGTTPEKVPQVFVTPAETLGTSSEIKESGLAELIEGTEANRKYLALHRTAPVGTILKVRNEMNNREVFVRVIGKLPDTALNDKLIIKVSKSAYDRLGAIDPRFRVEVTYYR